VIPSAETPRPAALVRVWHWGAPAVGARGGVRPSVFAPKQSRADHRPANDNLTRDTPLRGNCYGTLRGRGEHSMKAVC